MSKSLAGYLYAARTPEVPNALKLGCTSRDPAKRIRELAGTGSLLELETVFFRATPDPEESEDRLFLLLDAHDLRVKPRREFFYVNEAQALKFVELAIRTTPIPTSFVKRAPAQRYLAHKQPEWQKVLALPMAYRGEALTLGELMARSMTEPPVARHLEARGVECTYFDAKHPEFELALDAAVRPELLDAHGVKRPRQGLQSNGTHRVAFTCMG